jgi:elongation factor P
MIDSASFKRGACIQYKGAPMIVVDVTFASPTARGASTFVKTRLRNLLTGQLLSESIRSGEKFAEVDLEQHPASFMFSDGKRWHFMDETTYEQFDFGAEDLGENVGYLKDGQPGLKAMLIDGRVVSVALPNTVDLRVLETDPAIPGSTARAQMKPAKCETGISVLVPAYLTSGETIRVDTRDGHFVERVKS